MNSISQRSVIQCLWSVLLLAALPAEAGEGHRLIAKPATHGAAFGVAAKARGTAGVRLHKRYARLQNIEVLQVNPGQSPDRAAEKLRASGAYEYVEPDWVVSTTLQSNDPRYLDGTLWGLHNTGQSSGLADADIDASEGWAVRTDASSIVVAVIDTGVRATHEDLAANMWVNPGEIARNGIDDDGNGYVDDVHGMNAITGTGNSTDDHGHGTHVAGTIGAVGNNGRSVTGVAWRVRLMACKFLSSAGRGFTSDAIECIDYAVANGAKVLNNSWGGGGYSQGLQDAIEAAADAGVLFVAAAGNAGRNIEMLPHYPATYLVDNIVAVAASDRKDLPASFTNFGPGIVDLAAPGVDITSTGFASNSDLARMRGTSMAAPHVSGALALLRAQFPGDTYRQLFNRLLRSCDEVAALVGTARSGRLNLAKALTSTDARPLGDDIEEAIPILGDSTFLRTSTTGATAEPNESTHAGQPAAHSIWFRWTATASKQVVLSTLGSNFDTTLSLYVENAAGDLVTIAENDDADGTASRITFDAAFGTTYYIAVDGKAGASGLAVLRLAAPPANDNFADAATLDGVPVDTISSNIAASLEAGEPIPFPGAISSVWWRWTAPETGDYAVATAGSAMDTILAVYRGDSPGSLTLIAANDDEPPSSGPSLVRFAATAGTTFHIAVYGKNTEGAIRLRLARPAPNDHFAQAAALAGVNLVGSASNVGATSEPGEPNHVDIPGGRSLWWNWTAPQSGTYTLSLAASDYDTMLAVYTGSSLSGLTPVASNDDSHRTQQSEVVFTASEGTTYRIAVDGYRGDMGTIEYALLRTDGVPFNDNFANRSPIEIAWPPGSLSRSVDVVGSYGSATREPGEDGRVLSEKTIWYEWTAPVDGDLFVTTRGSSLYTAIDMMVGDGFHELYPHAFGEFTSDVSAFEISTSVEAGITYYFAVGGSAANGIAKVRYTLHRKNSAPVVTAASLTAASGPYPGTAVSVTGLTASDADGDPTLFTYQWQRSQNGLQFSNVAGATNPTFPAGVAQTGDLFRCRITPRDHRHSGPNAYTGTLAVRNRPPGIARHAAPFSYLASMPLRARSLATVPLIINEISQGGDASRTEWIELLVLRDVDLRGWRLLIGSQSRTLGNCEEWAAVPAGTLVVILQEPGSSIVADPLIPAPPGGNPKNDFNPFDDGVMIVDTGDTVQNGPHTIPMFSWNWPGLPNSGNATITIQDASGNTVDVVYVGSTQANRNPKPPTLGNNGWTRMGGNTESQADATANWATFRPNSNPPPAEQATPAAGNTPANAAWIAALRTGSFQREALTYRFAAASDIVPGLTLNASTGELSGAPQLPAGGLFHLIVERTGPTSGSIQESFDLLVADASGAYTVPAGRRWTLSGDVALDGLLVNHGTILTGPYRLGFDDTKLSGWLASHNLAGATGSDFDADRHPAVLEYLLGGNPKAYELLTEPLVLTGPGGQPHLAIRLIRRTNASEFRVQIRAGNSPGNLTDISPILHGAPEVIDAAHERVILLDPSPLPPSGRRFIQAAALPQ